MPKKQRAPRIATPSEPAAGLLVGSIPSAVLTSEPAVGIEPTTARLRIECSTTELRWRSLASDDRGTCPGTDSNRDALRHHPLKMACLPISPPGPCDLYDELRSAIRESEFQFQTSPLAVQHGSDGARTRDLSSDSRVL